MMSRCSTLSTADSSSSTNSSDDESDKNDKNNNSESGRSVVTDCDERCWAILENCTRQFFVAKLYKNRFLCGRDLTADYVLESPIIPDEMLRRYSRKHFILERRRDGENGYDVYIHDKSTTGTYVNGKLIGHNKCAPIVDKDIISLRESDLSAFRLILMGRECDDHPDNLNVTSLPAEILSNFIVGRQIGSGCSGSVRIGYKKSSSNSYEKFALKIVVKSESCCDVVEEASIIARLNHPCIVRVHSVEQNDKYAVLVLEYPNGGELLDRVAKSFDETSGRLSERIAKIMFYQILSAVQYMHSQNFCHRDLKLENVLLANNSECCQVKLIDFGLSKVTEDSSGTMTSFVGTLSYMAPEILRARFNPVLCAYTKKADVWSLGCILYSMLTGTAAFSESSGSRVENQILDGKYDRTLLKQADVSDEANNLVESLLLVDANERFSVDQAIRHSWFVRDKEAVVAAEVLISGGHVDAKDFVTSKPPAILCSERKRKLSPNVQRKAKVPRVD